MKKLGFSEVSVCFVYQNVVELVISSASVISEIKEERALELHYLNSFSVFPLVEEARLLPYLSENSLPSNMIFSPEKKNYAQFYLNFILAAFLLILTFQNCAMESVTERNSR